MTVIRNGRSVGLEKEKEHWGWRRRKRRRRSIGEGEGAGEEAPGEGVGVGVGEGALEKEHRRYDWESLSHLRLAQGCGCVGRTTSGTPAPARLRRRTSSQRPSARSLQVVTRAHIDHTSPPRRSANLHGCGPDCVLTPQVVRELRPSSWWTFWFLRRGFRGARHRGDRQGCPDGRRGLVRSAVESPSWNLLRGISSVESLLRGIAPSWNLLRGISFLRRHDKRRENRSFGRIF